MLHSLSSYGFTGRIFSFIKSFQMKVIINGNPLRLKRSTFSSQSNSLSTFYKLFAQEYTPNFFFNISAHDITIYGCNSKYNNTRGGWPATFSVWKIKLMAFHHYRVNLEYSLIAMDGCSFRESRCNERLLGLNLNPKLKRNWNI